MLLGRRRTLLQTARPECRVKRVQCGLHRALREAKRGTHLLADDLAGALLLDHGRGFRKHLLGFSRRCVHRLSP